jgi:hypothetical protein
MQHFARVASEIIPAGSSWKVEFHLVKHVKLWNNLPYFRNFMNFNLSCNLHPGNKQNIYPPELCMPLLLLLNLKICLLYHLWLLKMLRKVGHLMDKLYISVTSHMCRKKSN